jgi:micrococcal nuclease
MKTAGIATALLLLAASPASAGEFVLVGTLTHVRDGDTVVVAGTAIRLEGIAAPEKSEPMGKESGEHLKPYEGREVVCRLTGQGSFDRLVGRCALLGDDLGAMQLAAGLARRCAAFDPAHRYTEGPGAGLPLPAYCK